MSDDSSDISPLAEQVGVELQALGLKLVTAESCTGGWVAAAITEVAGSSAWFERGFVTYSNEAKQELLGVQWSTLSQHGAVSTAVVEEMARGAITHSHAEISVAISGIAGPGGGGPGKPVGTVCLAWVGPTATRSVRTHYEGDRCQVRRRAVVDALDGIIGLVTGRFPN